MLLFHTYVLLATYLAPQESIFANKMYSNLMHLKMNHKLNYFILSLEWNLENICLVSIIMIIYFM